MILLITSGVEVCDHLRSEDFSFRLGDRHIDTVQDNHVAALFCYFEPSITPFLECANLQAALPMFALDWIH